MGTQEAEAEGNDDDDVDESEARTVIASFACGVGFDVPAEQLPLESEKLVGGVPTRESNQDDDDDDDDEEYELPDDLELFLKKHKIKDKADLFRVVVEQIEAGGIPAAAGFDPPSRASVDLNRASQATAD